MVFHIAKQYFTHEVHFTNPGGIYFVEKKNLRLNRRRFFFSGDPYEIRTRVTAVKGRCLRPLDQRAELVAVIGFEPMTLRV